MKLYLSTNMYQGYEFDRVLPYLDEFEGKLGVEVFPMFHAAAFEPVLKRSMERLAKVSVTFHEPYYYAEHAAAEGSPEYARTMQMIRDTLPYMEELHAKYMVFHHSNKQVTPETKAEMLENARANYRGTERLCSERGILLAVENAGVGGNVLLDEEEFIRECRMLKCPVLVDIGHAYANGWDLRRVMEKLRIQIISYHLHNNDGVHDSHRRIHDGTLDFEKFLADYRELTPGADLVLEYSPAVADDEAGIREDIAYVLNGCLSS